MRTMNALIETIGEDFAFLSDNAKNFIRNNLDEDDVIDFERLIQYYQQLVKDTEQYDEFDNELLEKLKNSVKLLRHYLD